MSCLLLAVSLCMMHRKANMRYFDTVSNLSSKLAIVQAKPDLKVVMENIIELGSGQTQFILRLKFFGPSRLLFFDSPSGM